MSAKISEAEALAQDGKTAAAINLLEQAERDAPRDAKLRSLRAELLAKANRLRESFEEIQQAHRLAPDDLDVMQALLRLTPPYVDPVETERVARRAIALSPDKAIFHYYLGLAIANQNNSARYAEAMAALTQASTLAPRQQLAYTEMGKLAFRVGDASKSAAMLETALSLIDAHEQDGSTPPAEVRKQRASATFWLAEAYRSSGRAAEGRKMSALSARLNRENGRAEAEEARSYIASVRPSLP